MTIQEMHAFFDIEQDKHNAPYFLEEEKDVFINRAQQIIINQIVFNNKEEISQDRVLVVDDIESRLQSIEKLYTISINDLLVDSDVNGLIPIADINAAINAVSSGQKISHILSMYVDETNTGDLQASKVIKYIRYNSNFSENEFKKPKISRPYFKLDYAGINIIPKTGSEEKISISLIRTPVQVDFGSSIDCELPETLHDRVIEKALELASRSVE